MNGRYPYTFTMNGPARAREKLLAIIEKMNNYIEDYEGVTDKKIQIMTEAIAHIYNAIESLEDVIFTNEGKDES